MQHARDRLRELTDRSRLWLRVEDIVGDINRFLHGWAAYFKYGNSTRHFDKIRHYARMRLALLGEQTPPPQTSVRLVGGGSRLTQPAGSGQPDRGRRRPQTLPGLAGEAECRR
jgi:RNA-directed DNA polymerase